MSDEIGEWVAAQNKVTSKFLNKIGFRKKLEQRIKKLHGIIQLLVLVKIQKSS
jgi:prolyl oligopeptidase PreP (S9A serine peptidase family)